jgi:hypothetical protein
MTYAAEEVQPGWSVWASDGKELGTVVSVEQNVLVVKESGLLGGKIEVPRTAVDEVETGRVELSMTKDEIKSQS